MAVGSAAGRCRRRTTRMSVASISSAARDIAETRSPCGERLSVMPPPLPPPASWYAFHRMLSRTWSNTRRAGPGGKSRNGG